MPLRPVAPPLTRLPSRRPLCIPQKTIKKDGPPKKKGGYMNFCKSKREEWKKAGKKYTVPEQGKMLCALARPDLPTTALSRSALLVSHSSVQVHVHACHTDPFLARMRAQRRGLGQALADREGLVRQVSSCPQQQRPRARRGARRPQGKGTLSPLGLSQCAPFT